MKRFIKYYNSLSILFKFLLPSILALVFISLFYIYINLSVKDLEKDVNLVNKTLIPFHKNIFQNDLILEKISNEINSAVVTKELDLINNTVVSKKLFLDNLNKCDIEKYNDQLLEIKKSFNEYYDFATEVATIFIKNDFEFEYLYDNSQSIVIKYNTLKKQIQDLELELEKDIDYNTNFSVSLTNSILFNSAYLFIFYVLISFLIVFSIYKNLKNKIKAIILESEYIAEVDANFNKRISYKSSDELGLIVIAINKFVEKLDDKHKQLEEVKEEIKQFIADTVHQIRTPLSNIMLNTGIIKILQKDEKSNKYIDKINASINMLSNSYEDLSYITTYDTIEYTSSQISLSDILKDRVKFFEIICKVNMKPLEVEILSNININMNHFECERIIDNNIANAVKYADINNPINVILKTIPIENKVILQFKSFGKEIEDKVKIFDKNYRNDHSKRGLGLGLYMVKNICNKYDIKYNVKYQEFQNIFEYEFLHKI